MIVIVKEIDRNDMRSFNDAYRLQSSASSKSQIRSLSRLLPEEFFPESSLKWIRGNELTSGMMPAHMLDWIQDKGGVIAVHSGPHARGPLSRALFFGARGRSTG